jgi:hypothetical protein
MTKKVVQYVPFDGIPVMVGARAVIRPIDHPDKENVTNTAPAVTTEVVWADKSTGSFETRNTLYVLADQ